MSERRLYLTLTDPNNPFRYRRIYVGWLVWVVLFCGVLPTVVLTLFKLGQIGLPATWSWLWITSPLWVTASILGGLLVIFFVLRTIIRTFRFFEQRRRVERGDV